MSAILELVDPSTALDSAHAVVDQLQATDVTGAGDEALLHQLREVERLQRRLTALSYTVIAEVDSRGLPGQYGARSTTSFLRGLLLLEPGEAHARIKAAEAAAPRRSITTGQQLTPIFPHVAAAQAEGAISQRHALIIESTIDSLPDDVQAERGEQLESELVAYARRFDPLQLSKLALRLRECYDPDGAPEDQKRRERERELRVHQRTDGSGTIGGALSAELAERLLVLFDSLGAPQPAPDGTPDPRTAGQRRHDALLTALRTLQASGTLPNAGGVAATVVVTMSDAVFRSGSGLAQLGHGALIPAGTAFGMAGGDLRLLAVAVDGCKAITAYGHTHRLFTETQRLAIAARDGGCSFPGRDVAPGWCQTHHVRAYADGGPTSVDNGTLLCQYHHQHFERLGWSCEMLGGRPRWRPPKWLDRAGVPICNDMHDIHHMHDLR